MEVILISTDRTTTTNHHANELSHQLSCCCYQVAILEKIKNKLSVWFSS
jgi:hypothetical protein